MAAPTQDIVDISPRPERRTNAERSASTQEKVINAAIQCIYDVGYEGTSLNMVARRAGVSKGAAQYHFPSKAALMLAVAEYSLKLHVQMRGDIFLKSPRGSERIARTAEASWEIINHPSYTALIEIMMAARNNADLKNGMPKLIELITRERERGIQAFCRDFNVERNPLVETLIRTHVTAMRGIAVGLMYNPDKESFRRELEMMQRYEFLMREIIEKEYGKDSDPEQ